MVLCTVATSESGTDSLHLVTSHALSICDFSHCAVGTQKLCEVTLRVMKYVAVKRLLACCLHGKYASLDHSLCFFLRVVLFVRLTCVTRTVFEGHNRC